MYNAYVPRGTIAVTPSDTVELGPPIPTMLYISSAGALAIVTEDGSTPIYPLVAGGTFLAMRVRRVLATGTTASGIIAHY